jgi:hypothetical protein
MLIDMHRVRTLARAQCRCRGSCAFVHVACLQRWLQCRPASAGSLAAYNNVSATRRDVSEAVAPHCEVRAWMGQGLFCYGALNCVQPPRISRIALHIFFHHNFFCDNKTKIVAWSSC